MTIKDLTAEERQQKRENLKKLIVEYEKHLTRALDDGIENLAEIFKTQVKNLKLELDLLEDEFS